VTTHLFKTLLVLIFLQSYGEKGSVGSDVIEEPLTATESREEQLQLGHIKYKGL
jgi:hypothetical protein